MGNSESSSQFPSGEDGGNRSSDRGRANRPAADEGESQSWSALKVGAAMAGTGLLALGAWKLASSSPSSDEPQGSDTEDEGYRLPHNPKPISYLREAMRALNAIDLESSSVEGYSHPQMRLESKGSGSGSGKGGYTSDERYLLPCINPKPFSHLRIIKIMTYNVWSREDVKVLERMEAIGRLIQQHSPDVILFQEVTPKIYQIFQNFKWWKAYKCSVSLDEANDEQYFCMLLSKLPVRQFICERLKSSMGKVLSVAEIDVGMDKKLLAATSHLKSPHLPNTYSKERVAQAREVVRRLNSASNSAPDPAPNLVFGGDMNWDEDSDGLFPLKHRWVDAWAKLRPTESGWTYDTESNPMLQGYRPLQKRLDRFICKLKDFRMISVDMIGMEAIRGLSFRNTAGKVVPVLPSDHYGLLFTIAQNNNDKVNSVKDRYRK